MSLDKLVEQLNKKFAEGNEKVITIGFPKEQEEFMYTRIPTGSFTLDLALGGGLPTGCFTEIGGAYSSTKTTQTLHIIREAQKMGMNCIYLDIEGTTDDKYLQQLGVDMSKLIYSRPDSMEEATQLMLDVQRSGEVQLGVFDSIAMLIPNKEQTKSMSDSMQMGVKQNLLGEFFRKYQANNNMLSRKGYPAFTLIGVNQIREAIGAYGNPEYTPGGKAKEHAAVIKIYLKKGNWLKEGKGQDAEITGQEVKFKIEKNKTYRRGITGQFDFYFADSSVANVKAGYNDNIKEVIINSVAYGVIQRKGAYYIMGDKSYQGGEKLIMALKDDTELIKKLKDETMQLVLNRLLE